MSSKAPNLGDKFGRLTITRDGDRHRYAGREAQHWWCQCECGRDELVPQSQLSRRVAGCAVCRRGPCAVCGGEILTAGRSNVCGQSCADIKRQSAQNRSYAKRASANPDFNRERYLAQKQRCADDPDAAERLRESRARANRRYRSSPGGQAKNRAYQAERWRNLKQQITEQRQRFWASLTDAERAERVELQRASSREHQRRYRQWLADNPTELAAFRAKFRAWNQERNRQRALAELRQVADTLQEKLNDE